MMTRIREVRKARGLTLAEVGARCQPPTTAQTVGRLETGMRTVSVKWLNRIARALEVEPSELVTLPDRVDVPVAAIVGEAGVAAPRRTTALVPPRPTPAMIGLRFDVAQGDYRAGDELWLERLDPAAATQALNRDVLIPRPAGRFAFGRLAGVAPAGDEVRVQLLPATSGARQLVADVAWLAVARTLVRGV